LSPIQQLRLTFAAIAGASPSVSLQYSPGSGYTGNGAPVKHIKVYRPDGTLLVQGPDVANGISCNGSPGSFNVPPTQDTACTVQLASLPASGTYTIVVQPYITSGTVSVTATVK
jgi:hypothetical protein